MTWRMYQLWYSEAGNLRPGPRFRLLSDAIAHGLSQAGERSFAVRTPEGTWHRDSRTRRSIFGRGCSSSDVIIEPPDAPAICLPDIDDEDTQPFGSGSKQHRLRTSTSSGLVEQDDEPTDVVWPPLRLD